ncbi:MAG: type II toxin-antitoxin system VapC family toxin [Prosthecobacter sp.]|uniref:type II toxin-antitoxin system VapC family toxin n=1 Tax=Prosthecobacter sp. TaxID=1965333 RepID=UPI0039019473
MNVLLDTCTFIWLAMPQGKLSAAATQIINDPANRLYLSDVSVWEVCLKHSVGKLDLPDTPRTWVPQQMKFFQVESLHLDQDSIYRSGELPKVHPDPFDRLLAAQAIESGMTVLSPDTPLSSLGASRIW